MENNPYSNAYRGDKKKPKDSYIPQQVGRNDKDICHCSYVKASTESGCEICQSDLMQLIKQSKHS